MQKTISNYLATLAAGKTQNLVTSLPAESITEVKETPQELPKSRLAIPQQQVDYPADRLEEKRKKRRIPFVALALVLVFTSLYALSLLQLRPVALADNPSSPSSSPTTIPAIPEAAPLDQSVEFLHDQGNKLLGSGLSDSDCNSHKFRLANPLIVADPKSEFCWNQDDFLWGVRDITCIYNDMHGPPAWWTVHMVDKNDKDLNIQLDTRPLNQNTCTNNSECRSDNASRNDKPEDPNDPIHDQIGGDDILCGNTHCINDKHGSDSECGGHNGPQKQYDRFACEMKDQSSVLEDQNWKAPSASEVDANLKEKRWWWSTGVAINPTAYDPNGALYLPTTNLRAADIEPSAEHPTCDASNHWSCKNNASIIVYQYNGSLTKSNSTGQYEEATPHYTPAQFRQAVGLDLIAKANAPQAWNPGSAPVPVFWVTCGAEGGWAFPCSDPNSSANMPFTTTEDKSQSLDHNQVAEGIIVKDWLSGDFDLHADSHPITLDSKTSQPIAPQPPSPGHLVYTYLNDTVYQPGIQVLFGYSMAFGLVLITPVLILIGYQFIWASWTLGRANAMEAFGRIILSISAIAISYQVAAMLITLTNTFNTAIVNFHALHGYPSITIDNQESTFTLTKQGENDPASFRGIVIPITRWGCVANDFVALLGNKFWTDVAGFVPFVGGIAKFIANIFNAIDVAKHVGEFVSLILTIMLCTQVFMRVLLLNYYILTGPLAFGCWGLPGGVGQRVVSSWAKGFVSLLFAQTAQIFVLATFPLIMPSFPTFPSDRFGLLNVLFQALPRILVLAATIKVPTVMGTGATKAIAQAGTVVGGAVAAAGAAAMNIV